MSVSALERSSQERYHGIDLVRSVAMLLGIVIHVSIFFMDDQFPLVLGERYTDPVNRLVVEFIHLFRMQLFILLAGFFAQLVMDRKGLSHLVRDRLKRIVLPFIIGVILFIPFHNLVFGYLGMPGPYRTVMGDLSFSEHFKTLFLWGAFTDKPALPVIGFWHFWFLYYLIILYTVHYFGLMILKSFFDLKKRTVFDRLLRYSLSNKRGVFFLGVLCFPIHYSLIDPIFPPNQFNFDCNNIGYYLVYYLAGVLIYRNRDLLEKLSTNCYFFLAIGLSTVPFTFSLTTSVGEILPSAVHDLSSFKVSNFSPVMEDVFSGGIFKVAVVLIRSCTAWLFCFGFIGLAGRYVVRPNIIIKYISDSAYWIYFIHVIITFGLSIALARIDFLNSLSKTYIVLVVSTLFLFWTYNKFVRYTFLGNYFMGRRKRREDENEDDIQFSRLFARTIVPLLLLFPVVFLVGEAFRMQSIMQRKNILIEARLAQDSSNLGGEESIDGIQDRYARTPLHYATMTPQGWRDYNPLELLISRIGDVDARDCMGRTALFQAVRTGNPEDVDILLDAGANPDTADQYRHTPAHVAAMKAANSNGEMAERYQDMLLKLKEAGADFSLRDSRGRSVEDWLNK